MRLEEYWTLRQGHKRHVLLISSQAGRAGISWFTGPVSVLRVACKLCPAPVSHFIYIKGTPVYKNKLILIDSQ